MPARLLLPPRAQALRLPKAVRWNKGSDAELFMRTVFQTVLIEFMQLYKAICLYWLARRIIHVDVNATSRALLRESHNFFLREDPMEL